MIKKYFDTKLGKDILFALIKSLLIAIGFFTIMYITSFLLAYKTEQSHRIKMNYATKDIMEELIKVTKDNELTSKDTDDIKYIDKRYDNTEITIVKDSKLIYSTDENEKELFNDNDRNSEEISLDIDGEGVERIFTLDFKDGDAVAIIKERYDNLLLISLTVINAILSISIFVVIFFKYLKKKIDYINEIEKSIYILESGDLDYIVRIQGNDELASLARSINNMRSSMKERIVGETRAQSANKELITNISHDIRTPLTPIIGYLTLLKEGRYSNKEQENKYIDVVLEKANQLKKRTDLLFEYSLIYSNQKELEKNKISAYELTEQFVFESTLLLNKNGFGVEHQNSIEKDMSICVDANQINRVFDNVISNILKYGDESENIKIKFYEFENMICIDIVNKINKSDNFAESTGLGLNICKSILNLHGGDLKVTNNNELFIVNISLPI